MHVTRVKKLFFAQKNKRLSHEFVCSRRWFYRIRGTWFCGWTFSNNSLSLYFFNDMRLIWFLWGYPNIGPLAQMQVCSEEVFLER